MPNLMQIKNQAATLLADNYQEYLKCFISIRCQFYLTKVPGVIYICMYSTLDVIVFILPS